LIVIVAVVIGFRIEPPLDVFALGRGIVETCVERPGRIDVAV
jgi:hypothetical protein